MKRSLVRSLLAGFVATLCFSFMTTFVSPLVVGVPIDEAGVLDVRLDGGSAAEWLAGLLAGSVVLPLLYLVFLRRRLPGGSAVRGLTWGVLLWLLSQAAVMPLMGGGLFSSESGGWIAVVDSLLGHAAYGVVFGLLLGNESGPPARLVNSSKPGARRPAGWRSRAEPTVVKSAPRDVRIT